MSDAWEWGKDVLTPDKAKASTPGTSAGWNAGADVRSSEYAMSKGQRDVDHYQAGVEMSAPLQGIADRGQARGDMAQNHLASASSNAAALGGQSLAYGEKGYNAGMAGAAMGAQANQALGDAGSKGGALGAQYGNMLAGQGMAGAKQAATGQGMAGQSYGDMRGMAGSLAGLEAQQGPSAAQAQLRMATNAGQAQNLAMARSGGGFGGSASRSAQALRQNAAMNQGAANQSAMLKAGEDAAWRQRQAANLQGAGGMYGQAGQLGLGAGQLGLAGNAQAMQGLESGGQMALAGNAQNLTGLQAGAQAGLAGQGMALQGAQTGLSGVGQAVQGQQAAGQLAATGYGLGFQGDTQAGQAIAQDQAAKQAYENMLTQQMGIQSGVSVANAQSANAFTGGLISAAAGAGGMLAMSDERRKNIGNRVNVSSELYGNPYGRRGAPGSMSDSYVMSDERNKQAPSLRGVPSYEYEYRDPDLPGAEPGLQVGPMAQDIERAIPGAVDDTPHGKMVDPARTVLPLLSAVGEQQARIDALEARLAEQPDLRTAENAHRPKGPSGLSFEAYDAISAPARPNRAMAQGVSPNDEIVAAQSSRDALMQRHPTGAMDEELDVQRLASRNPKSGSRVAALTRAALTTGGNLAMLPVTTAGKAARSLGFPNRAAELDAGEAVADVESLIRDEGLADSRERARLGQVAHPISSEIGDEIGASAAMAGMAGAARAVPAAKRAGKDLATEAAARAYDSPLNVRTNIVPGERLAGDPRLGSVQRFLNEERAAASEYQRLGYDELVERYGPERAAEIKALTDETQSALSQQGNPTTVYRGQLMAQDDLDALQPGTRVSNPNIWSAGTTRERAGSFSRVKEGDKRSPVLYEINARTGATADDIPGSNTYEEALLPAGGKFGVKGRRVETLPDGRRVNVVQLDEVDTDTVSELTKARDAVEEAPSGGAPGVKPVKVPPTRRPVESFLRAHPDADALHDYIGGSVSINRELREAGQGLPPRSSRAARDKYTKQADRVSRVLNDAESAGYTHDGVTHRGLELPKGVADKWVNNGFIDNASFWSSSKKDDVADSFARFAGEEGTEPVVLRIKSRSGVPLGKEGLMDGSEEEVLFDRGKKWRVTGEEKLKDGTRVIDIEQIDKLPEGVKPEIGSMARDHDRRHA